MEYFTQNSCTASKFFHMCGVFPISMNNQEVVKLLPKMKTGSYKYCSTVLRLKSGLHFSTPITDLLNATNDLSVQQMTNLFYISYSHESNG